MFYRVRFGLWAVVLALLAIAVYRLEGQLRPFVWDDRSLLIEDSVQHLPLSQRVEAYFTQSFLGNYQPLTMLSYELDRAIASDAWWMHRWMNVLLHILCSCLVALLAARLCSDRRIGLLASVLFAVSPLHVENVAWVAERKSLMAGLFSFLAMYLYAKYLKQGDGKRLWLTWFAFVAALLSKGTAVMLPVSFLGLALLLRKQGPWPALARSLAPFFAVSLIAGVGVVLLQHEAGYMKTEHGISLASRIVLSAAALWMYAVKLVLPFGCAVLHPMPATVHIAFVALAIAGSSMVSVFLYWPHHDRLRRLGYVLLYAGPLMPLIQLLPFGEALWAERYAYLPSVPVFIACAWIMVQVYERFRPGAVAGALCALAIVVPFAWSARQRVQLWNDPISLFEHDLHIHPGSSVLQCNLAALLQGREELAGAEAHFRVALDIDKEYMQAWKGLGEVLLARKQYVEAIGCFDKVQQVAPQFEELHRVLYNRGLAKAGLGDMMGAMQDQVGALHIVPDFSDARYQLGVCQAAIGDHRAAVASYGVALGRGYTRPELYLNRAISLGWLKNRKDAIKDLDRVVASGAYQAEAYFLRGLAKLAIGINGCADLKDALDRGHPRAREALSAYCAAAEP